jgi:NAD(P)-dependent dehydrogenase (short-subunit alcohol dehydrogenase family)
MLKPAGRVVMVSGASRGIGRAVVDGLLEAGFTVSAGLRDPAVLSGDGGLLARHPGRLLVCPYDAEDPGSPAAWVERTAARFGAVHGLVNAAGINTRFHLDDADETALDALWLVNVKGPLRLLRAALPHLRACGSGRVVNLASLSGKRVINDNVGYAMTKFAVTALTQAVRREAWNDGVRATALCPGLVNTDMTAGYRDQVDPSDMTDPIDLAALVETLLCLPNSASVAELLVNCRWEANQ